MQSLQSITDAWGKWLAKKSGTSMKFTASTKYSSHSELDKYHEYQCTTTYQSINYDGNSPPTGNANVTWELWYDNATEAPQSEVFQHSSSTEQSFTWSITEELSVGVKVSATVGEPAVASVSGEVSTTLTLSSTQSATTTNTQTWQVDTPINVPPNSTVKCDMVLSTQSYDINYTADVLLDGYVAIWFEDQVNQHWLWFHPIESVFHDVINNNLANTSGYTIVPGGVTTTAKGKFTGSQGVSVGVQTTQYPLRSSVSAAQFVPVSTTMLWPGVISTPEAGLTEVSAPKEDARRMRRPFFPLQRGA